jgi:hypothetical protein
VQCRPNWGAKGIFFIGAISGLPILQPNDNQQAMIQQLYHISTHYCDHWVKWQHLSCFPFTTTSRPDVKWFYLSFHLAQGIGLNQLPKRYLYLRFDFLNVFSFSTSSRNQKINQHKYE